tara:strand:+ start:665 stop:1201 length:537 start_codon:yes stop_codon:yes gene_type:complete
MANTTDVQTNTVEHSNGRVKWFNNKAGYGFLTVSSGDEEGSDVFVHHTAIQVGEEQFKYLVEGEYVEFLCTEASDSSKHKYQASGVRGVNGGKLMCETRNQSRSARTDVSERTDRGNQSRNRAPQSSRFRGGGPRVHSVPDSEDGNVEWLLVRRKRPSNDQNGGQKRNSNPARTSKDD